MEIIDTFDEGFRLIALESNNKFGFVDWEVVQILHTNDEIYHQGKNDSFNLGFQPMTLVLANPFTQESRRILIKNVNDDQAGRMRAFCRDRYSKQLPNRSGSFRPEVYKVFAEYDSWDAFYSTWLEHQGKPVYMHNLIMLLDHTPKIEYWSRKQTGETILPYQRLLITTFFAPKRQFFDFIIKEIDDSAMDQIRLILNSRIVLNIDQFFAVNQKVNNVT